MIGIRIKNLIVVLLGLLIVLMVGGGGCSLIKKQDLESPVVGYETMGRALCSIYEKSINGCDTGVINTDECRHLKKLYNQTRKLYIESGEYLILALDTPSVSEREELLEKYFYSQRTLSEMIVELARLSSKSEIRGGE